MNRKIVDIAHGLAERPDGNNSRVNISSTIVNSCLSFYRSGKLTYEESLELCVIELSKSVDDSNNMIYKMIMESPARFPNVIPLFEELINPPIPEPL